jgi:hypothetical protein
VFADGHVAACHFPLQPAVGGDVDAIVNPPRQTPQEAQSA